MADSIASKMFDYLGKMMASRGKKETPEEEEKKRKALEAQKRMRDNMSKMLGKRK